MNKKSTCISYYCIKEDIPNTEMDRCEISEWEKVLGP